MPLFLHPKNQNLCIKKQGQKTGCFSPKNKLLKCSNMQKLRWLKFKIGNTLKTAVFSFLFIISLSAQDQIYKLQFAASLSGSFVEQSIEIKSDNKLIPNFTYEFGLELRYSSVAIGCNYSSYSADGTKGMVTIEEYEVKGHRIAPFILIYLPVSKAGNIFFGGGYSFNTNTLTLKETLVKPNIFFMTYYDKNNFSSPYLTAGIEVQVLKSIAIFSNLNYYFTTNSLFEKTIRSDYVFASTQRVFELSDMKCNIGIRLLAF